MVQRRLSVAGAATGQRDAGLPVGVCPAVLALLVAMLVLVGVPVASACAASATAVPTSRTSMKHANGIFVDATRQGTLAQPAVPTVVRSRFVEVDFGRLRGGPEGPPGELTLNLFDDAVLIASLDHLESASSGSGFVWVGKVQGAATSEVTLVVGDGMLTGNVMADGATYQIRFAGNGVHVVLQTEPGSFPAD
ncbi:MAG TPA: hypothetical protein VFH48_28240 [Chloroflexota bacterium]|nr:hypothetical protein [Chloroflexota bacterium]